MPATAATTDEVRSLVVGVLGIQDREADLGPETELLGSLPELDSLAVVEILTAIEERFGIAVDDADVGADTFETLATLAAFVEEHRA